MQVNIFYWLNEQVLRHASVFHIGACPLLKIVVQLSFKGFRVYTLLQLYIGMTQILCSPVGLCSYPGAKVVVTHRHKKAGRNMRFGFSVPENTLHVVSEYTKR